MVYPHPCKVVPLDVWIAGIRSNSFPTDVSAFLCVQISERAFEIIWEKSLRLKCKGKTTTKLLFHEPSRKHQLRAVQEDIILSPVLSSCPGPSASHDTHPSGSNRGSSSSSHEQQQGECVSAEVDRGSFYDAVCQALLEYRYMSADTRSDLDLACR